MQVKPDAAIAQRSNASGRLQLVMPKEDPGSRDLNYAHIRWAGSGNVSLLRLEALCC